MRSAIGFVVASLVLIAPSIGRATDANLDPSFGAYGFTTVNVIPTEFESASDVAIQSTGRIIVVGAGFSVLGFTPAGALDGTFGTGGITTTATGGFASAVAIQTDDRIVVAGSADGSGNAKFAVVRYDANGTLDGTFGIGGIATVDIGPLDTNFEGATAVAIQTDGSIVVAGHRHEGSGPIVQRIEVVRLLGNGTLDATFGTGGIVQIPLSGWSHAAAVAIQPDDKIVVAGHTYVPYFSGNIQAFLVLRLDSGGALDSGFDSDGIVVAGPGPEGSRVATGLALQPDDKIVIGGFAGSNVAALRYLPSGSPDGAFGTGGLAKTQYENYDFAFINDLVLRPDGKIVLTGGVRRNGSSNSDTALVRFNDDGSVDTTFTPTGRARIVIGARYSAANGVAQQSDGKIVVAGLAADANPLATNPDSSVMVARFGGSCGNAFLDAGEQCDDGNTSGTDCCSAGCALDPAGQICDTVDASLCTFDTCDGAGNCQLGGAWPPSECYAVTQPNKSALVIRDKANAAKDLIKWKWSKGQDLYNFGIPTFLTSYAFCVTAGGTLVSENPIATGSGWTSTATGWRLKRDPQVTPGGIGSLRTHNGGPGASLITLKGKGPNVAPASPPLTTPVTAQLISSGGACYGATYTAPSTNAPGNFRAKGQ